MKANIIHILSAIGVIALSGASLNLAAQTVSTAAPKSGGDYPYLNTGAPSPALYGVKEENRTAPAVAAPQQVKSEQAQVAFRTTAETRRDAYIAFNFGENVVQQGNMSVHDNYGKGDLKSSAGFATSFRGGYTWQLGNAPDNLLAFSLEGEMLYTWNSGSKLEGTYGGVKGETGKFDVHIWALTVNPVLRFQLGKFVPYIGVGAGGALVLAANPVEGTAGRLVWDNSRYGMAFAFQGMVGADHYVSDSWSIFLEYKYLGLVGLELNDQLNGRKSYDNYKSDGVISNHIVSFGARWHF